MCVCVCVRVCQCALSLNRDLTLELEHRPVREGVLGQVQVGEVGTAAPQQGPEQLAEKKKKGKPMRLRCVVLAVADDVILLCNSDLRSSALSKQIQRSSKLIPTQAEGQKKREVKLIFCWPANLG